RSVILLHCYSLFVFFPYSSLSRSPIPLPFLLPISPPAAISTFPYTTLFRSRKSITSLSGDMPLRLQRLSPPSSDRFSEQSRISRSEEHTSELQSRFDLVCRLLLEKKKMYRSTEHKSELQSRRHLVCRLLLEQ